MLFVFSGKDGRVTGRTESLPESQMDYAHFLQLHAYLSPSPFLFYLLETASIIDVAFSCVWHDNKGTVLPQHALAVFFSHSFPVYRSFFIQSVAPPFFYLSVLMIYFAGMSDLCWNSATSKECFMSIISIVDNAAEETRLDILWLRLVCVADDGTYFFSSCQVDIHCRRAVHPEQKHNCLYNFTVGLYFSEIK